ncbi:hypothetical protein [Virgibacillus pantothenticus]
MGHEKYTSLKEKGYL